MNFKDKLKQLKLTDMSIADSAWVELLTCLTSAISDLTTQSEFEIVLENEMLKRITETDVDRAMSVGQMVQAYQILKKKKSEDLASILGILKQQIVTQQTKPPEESSTSGENKKQERELNPLSKEEVKDAKEVLEFIDLLKKNTDNGI